MCLLDWCCCWWFAPEMDLEVPDILYKKDQSDVCKVCSYDEPIVQQNMRETTPLLRGVRTPVEVSIQIPPVENTDDLDSPDTPKSSDSTENWSMV